MVGDGSVQLLQAAAAANHAQAIIITLLEEYDSLFREGSVSPELYSDSEESGSETEELSDDDETFEDDGDDDATEGSDTDVEEDVEHASSGTNSETGDNDVYDHKGSKSPEVYNDLEANQKVSSCPQGSLSEHDNVEESENFSNRSNNSSVAHANDSGELLGDDPTESSSRHKLADKNPSTCNEKLTTVSNGPVRSARRLTVWGRTPARKNLSMESIDMSSEDEAEIQKLEVTKTDLQNRIAEEAKGNATLLENMEKRKNALHERRLALEQEVAKLQEQLQKERELRTFLEAGLEMSQGALPVSATIDEKVKAELEEIAQAEADVIDLKKKADDLGVQINQQREQNCCSVRDSCNEPHQTQKHQGKQKEKQMDSEATAASRIFEKSTRSKVPPSLPNKHSPRNQQSESGRSSKSGGAPATSSSVEQGIGRPATTNHKKFGTRSEGTNSTTSALSKLTNRLNFLKERRTQITTEIQKHERGGRGSESFPEGQSSSENKGVAMEIQNSEKHNKSSDCLSLQNLDKGIRSEGLPSPNLDRGKSESFPNVDNKGRSVVTPRTFSR